MIGMFLVHGESILFDFDSEEKSGQWYIVNDGVMGGISESEITLNDDGTATFRGDVSLENNGGFASVRALVDEMNDTKIQRCKIKS